MRPALSIVIPTLDEGDIVCDLLTDLEALRAPDAKMES